MTLKTLTFEQALEKLEHTVKTLEAGDLPLDEVLQLFEEGVGLVKTCHKKLNEAEQKVEVLISGMTEENKEPDGEGRRENSGY
ncbi:exodeoxyribonuclease VII small subunit [Candidatus Formimonas warabiya]|uniref:Exodeoxyribonuclease 7 small subunit n=1 Tax=Formimonas warabiya TaxID=1761012 RepID=A0A3G1KPJ2_FORW1|nr:exodeoxyribonuclease VII small subunit [Candidatus Formimonas warabiya]ATW24055.1 exodeoxyribonuclease VII small subunit [Candidatus Formimonas warabiya]